MDRNKSARNGSKFNSYNASMMGPLAYHVVYPSAQDTPDCDFVAVKDKGKKSPSTWAKSPFRTKFEMLVYLLAARLVAEHYLSAVGRFYNAAVVLSNYAYIRKYKTGESSEALELALAIVWRLMYEGLGLAGWTPPARLFLAILVSASFNLTSDKRNPKFTYQKDGDWEDSGYPAEWAEGCKPSIVTKDTPEKLRIPALPWLCKLAGVEHLGNQGKAAFRYILWAVKVSLDWGAIEAGKRRVEFMSENEKYDAYVYGALRRAGQGSDKAGLEELSFLAEMPDDGEDGYITPQSCLRACLGEDGELEEFVKEKLGGHPLLIETLEMAAKSHTLIEDFIFAKSYGGDVD